MAEKVITDDVMPVEEAPVEEMPTEKEPPPEKVSEQATPPTADELAAATEEKAENLPTRNKNGQEDVLKSEQLMHPGKKAPEGEEAKLANKKAPLTLIWEPI